MTTIAYRYGVLAADTGVASGGVRCGRLTKIVRSPSGNLGGAAGSATYCEAFKNWMAGGQRGDPPEPKEHRDCLDQGAVFWPDGSIEVHELDGRFRLSATYYALGSGRSEALGAMYAGADAALAVRCAMEHDEGTFGEITVLTHEKGKSDAVVTKRRKRKDQESEVAGRKKAVERNRKRRPRKDR